MNFTCIDNSKHENKETVANRVLTVGKEYKGRVLAGNVFVEIFPCDDDKCWVFDKTRFVEEKEEN